MFKITAGGYYVSHFVGRSKERLTAHYELELSTFSDAQSAFDDRLYKRIEGSVFLARPNQRRHTIGNYEGYFFYFDCDDPAFVARYLDPLPNQIYNVDTYRFIQHMKDVIYLYRNRQVHADGAYQMYLDARVTTILLELYHTAQNQIGSPESSKHAANISAACQYIREHFREPIGMEEISRAAMLSHSFTYNMFKQFTGQTPHEFLTGARIRYACEQLIYTSQSIGEICLACGFTNPNYLYYIFPKYTNMTPGEYRRFYQKK